MNARLRVVAAVCLALLAAIFVAGVVIISSMRPARGASCAPAMGALCEIYVSARKTKITRRWKRPRALRSRHLIKSRKRTPPRIELSAMPVVPMPRPAPPRTAPAPAPRQRIARSFEDVRALPILWRDVELPAVAPIERPRAAGHVDKFAGIVGGSAALAIAAFLAIRRRRSSPIN
jgi:hypothetical protein